MSVNYNFTKCSRWLDLFFGLTPEQCEAEGINVEEWVNAIDSPWMQVEPDSDKPLMRHFAAKGCVIVAQHGFVRKVMMALIPCMPAPGWGLSKKNIDEAVRRLLIYQEATQIKLAADFMGKPKEGEQRKSYWQQRWVTGDEIRMLEGLRINFSTVNISTFRKNIEGYLEDNYKARERRAREKAKEAAAAA